VLAEWEKQQTGLHEDEINFDVRIRELKTQAQLTVDKIKYLSSEVAIKYMEEELIKNEAEVADLEVQKEKMKVPKSTNIDRIVAYVSFFLEHLQYLLLQGVNPIARASYFGVLFDTLPTYENLISGTPKMAPALELNQVFIKNNMDARLMVGYELPRWNTLIHSLTDLAVELEGLGFIYANGEVIFRSRSYFMTKSL
jgi:hypothetical protein